MDHNRAIIFTEGTLGGTFLDWTLYYFSNTEKFYNPLNGTWSSLVKNPITKNNAHLHTKIHPTSIDDFKFCIEQIAEYQEFYSIYPYPAIGQGFDLSDENKKYTSEADWQKTFEIYKQSHQLYQNYILDHNLKTLIVREFPQDRLYHFFNQRVYDKLLIEDVKLFYKKFFANNENECESMEQWDFREKLALAINPFDSRAHLNINLPDSLVYNISFDCVLNHLDSKIETILEFFNLSFDKRKFHHWQQVYIQWKQVHDTKFYRNWQTILDHIVSGGNHELSQYNMNFLKDVFIQHILLYKYNLAIKGYGLEKLPSNTRLIYNLLEPNVYHNLDNNYQEFIKNV